MKSFFTTLLAMLLAAMLAPEIRAQSFSIDWFAIAGGGAAYFGDGLEPANQGFGGGTGRAVAGPRKIGSI
jgi:hypothetical protein